MGLRSFVQKDSTLSAFQKAHAGLSGLCCFVGPKNPPEAAALAPHDARYCFCSKQSK